MHLPVPAMYHFVRKYKYFPSEIMNENNVIVRPWRPGDTQGVLEVMREGVMHNIWPYYVLIIKKKLSVVVVLLAGSFVHWYWAQTTLLTLISLFAVYLSFYLILLLIAQFYYYYTCTDLWDIEKSFFSSDLSSFWVAEVRAKSDSGGDNSENVSMIVGIIAVVPKTLDFCDNANLCVESEQGQVAWLRRLAVLSHFQGLGIAKKLVEETISFCRLKGFDRIDLITTEGQVASQRLWKRIGFECKGFNAFRYFKVFNVWTYEFSLDLKKKVN